MKGRWDLNWLLAPLLTVFAVAPLAHPGYFWGAHDGRHSVYFLVEFDRSFRDGILYPRWMPDFNSGYGYPFFNIYQPGAFYIGEALHLAGLDFVTASKVVFALGVALSALTMYLLARRLWGPSGGLLAAVSYVYVPYRMVDLYVRGAQAESLAFAFFPLVLWAFDRLAESPGPRRLALASLALAAAIFAHYPLAILFLVFVAGFVLVRVPPSSDLSPARWLGRHLWSAGAVAGGIGLSAILLLPAVLEYSGVRTDQWAGGYYDFRDHFVEFFQLLSPAWGTGTSTAGPDDTMPFQLGAAALVLAILALAWGLRRSSALDAAHRRLIWYLAAAAGASVFLMTEAAAPVWDLLRLAAFAQFPWRMLTFTGVFLPLLAGALPAALAGASDDAKARAESTAIDNRVLLAPVLAVIILAGYPYLSPQMVDPPEGPVSLAGLMRFQQSANEMTGMTAWATAAKPPGWGPLADVFATGKDVTEKVAREHLPPGAEAVTVEHNSVLDVVSTRSAAPFELRFYTAYYPGWRVTVDGVETAVSIWGDLGGISVAVPAGEHMVELRFGDTWPRTLGTVVSITCLAASMAALAWPRRRGNKPPGLRAQRGRQRTRHGANGETASARGE